MIGTVFLFVVLFLFPPVLLFVNTRDCGDYYQAVKLNMEADIAGDAKLDKRPHSPDGGDGDPRRKFASSSADGLELSESVSKSVKCILTAKVSMVILH